MGEQQIFQPLTREDRVTVVIYRVGIVLSTVLVSVLAYLFSARAGAGSVSGGHSADLVAGGLFISVGLSVFFIHLYIGKFKAYLRNLYLFSLACLVLLLILGKGSLAAAYDADPRTPLLLLPLSGCLGFVTAKEAFCFKLVEGYLLAVIMPMYLLLLSVGALAGKSAASGLVLIAAMLVLFTLRKVFQPLAWDIGDKSAYR